MPTHEFSGAAVSPLAGNTIDTNENMLTIENGAGSGRKVYVWCGFSIQDQIQAYCTPMVVFKCSALPTGGNLVTKPQIGGGGLSASQVVVRASRTTDNGAVTAITTSGESRAWAVWPPTNKGSTHVRGGPSVWGSPMDQFIELLEGEALLLQHAFATSPNDVTNANKRESGMIYWEEWAAGVPSEIKHTFKYVPLRMG